VGLLARIFMACATPVILPPRTSHSQAALTHALETCHATGPPGQIDISTVDTAALDVVINDALSGRTQVRSSLRGW
jgi:hypothetical protein